jgi:hypothetical protein
MDMIPFEKAIRTEWKTTNRKKLFDSLLKFFPQLTADDLIQINTQIEDDNIGYFEVAHYEDFKNAADPKMLLVFQGKRVFIDILNPLHKDELIAHIQKTIDSETKFIKSRDMTLAEWKKRLQVMLQLTPKLHHSYESESDYTDDDDLDEEEYYSDYETSVPCDEEGHLKRSAFQLIAKQPAVDWANEAELKFHNLEEFRIKWDLQNINEEPDIFLGPDLIEFESKSEQARLWAKLKERAFYNFLESFYPDDYWPEVTQRKFSEWFELVQLGCVIDLADDL